MKRIFYLLVCVFGLHCMDDEKPAKKKKIEATQLVNAVYEYCEEDDRYKSLIDNLFIMAAKHDDIKLMQILYKKSIIEYDTLHKALANMCKSEAWLVNAIMWLFLHGADFSYWDAQKAELFVDFLKTRGIPKKFIDADINVSKAPFVWKECAQEALLAWEKDGKPAMVTTGKALMVACLWSVVRLYEICECEDVWEFYHENFSPNDIVQEYEGCYDCVKKVGMLEHFEHAISFQETTHYYYKDLQEFKDLVGRYKVRGALRNNQRLASLYNVKFLYL